MSDTLTQEDQREETPERSLGAHEDVESQEKTHEVPSDDFSHGFWDRDVAGLRKAYLIGLARVTVAICALIWAVVTIYWGSLWKASELSPNLTGYVINRDSGPLGANITAALLATNSAPPPHLTWTSVMPSRYPTEDDVMRGTAVDEDAWVFVDILQDASTALEMARTNAAASWDPTSVIKVYYAEARNQQSVDGTVLAAVRSALTPAMAMINAQSAAQWLSSNAGNTAAITAVASTAPQTIAGAVGMSMFNLRPWSASVSIAPTFVGLIYAVILAFNVTMANFAMRQGLQKKLRLRSFILMRILVPIVCYFFLSAMFSMINLPFRLPFGGMGLTGDPYGAGFMIWWSFTFLGMVVLGLCTEAFLSLVGPQFIGFCLVFLIIINVSVANLPIEQQVSLYRYGYAMPFYNLRLAYITIIYNIGHHSDLFKYMGILFGWVLVLFLTMPIWVWRERRAQLKAASSKSQ